MKVLIACEYSGRVRDAFIKRGHEAISCDLLPTESPGPHYQGDIFDALDWRSGGHFQFLEHTNFDLMIAHPPCTYLTCSAEWAYRDPDYDKYPDAGYHQRVKPGTLTGAARRKARVEAIEFVKRLLGLSIPRIAIENPVGVLTKEIGRPAQYIHPYEFGDDASKKTCLWLKGLNPLVKYLNNQYPPRVVEYPKGSGKYVRRWGNQTDSGQNIESPGPNRWKTRSTTWQGWADAMADQWGSLQPLDIK